MLNNVNIMGRIVRTPELRTTPDGVSVCSFSIACERYANAKGDKVTDFIDIVAWRKTAEFVTAWFGKGDSIIVTGRLQTRQYTDRDGNNRRAVEVVASEVNFGGGKARQNEYGQPDGAEIDDEEVPF